MKVLGITASPASELIKKMIEMNLIYPIKGKGKGKYLFSKPSVFIKSKDSEYYADNKEVADYQCDFIMNKQLDDGSWDITWNWEEFPEEWAVSKNWWKGQVIIENLLYLKGFGKI